MKTHGKFIAKSRFRRREGRAGRWRDGGAEIRRFGRGRKRVIFLLYPMSQYEHFGPPEAPGPFEGFSGPPSQGPTEGSRGRAEGPDRQSDAVARDPSKGDGASSVRRCRRPGTRSFERRTRFVRIVQSAGEASHDEALLQNVAGKRERAVQESDALNSRPSRSSPTNS